MIKNVALKKFLKGSVFRAISFLNRAIPKDDGIILLYSANRGIEHSLVPFRKYLIKNDFHNRYKIICGIENMKYAEDDNRVRFVERLSAYTVFLRAKHVFYTAGQIPIKPARDQCVIHLRHGNTNFKTSGRLTNINNGDEFFFTHMIASAPIFKRIMSEEYGCPEENIVVAGDALIDELLDEDNPRYDFSAYDKVMLWLPTFRQSDYLGYDDSEIEELVPLFKEEDYEQLNNHLAQYNIKLIVKLHPAQKNFRGGKRHFDFLDVYTNDEFLSDGFQLYPLMAQADVLIGDYSSASMQFLILDRPQAYVIPDIEEYGQKRGFIFEEPEEYMAGHIIKTKNEFFAFVDDIANERDLYVTKRQNVRKKVYTYADNQNCERIARLSGLY